MCNVLFVGVQFDCMSCTNTLGVQCSICRCTVCDLGNDASSRRGSVYSDSVHDFDPLALSSTSSTIIGELTLNYAAQVTILTNSKICKKPSK